MSRYIRHRLIVIPYYILLVIHMCEGYEGGVRGRMDSYARPSVPSEVCIKLANFRGLSGDDASCPLKNQIMPPVKLFPKCSSSLCTTVKLLIILYNHLVQLPAYVITIDLIAPRVWHQWCSFE